MAPALLAALLFAPPVLASDSVPQGSENERYFPGEDAKEQDRILRVLAKALLAKGRLDEALKVLVTLEARNPDDRDLQIAIAQTEIRMGQYDRAIFRLSALRNRYPDWPRPRLELALGYEASGRLSEAREILVDELGRDPPPAVRRNLQARIRSIEDRMPFVGRFSIGIVPDSNVTGGTHNESVEFLGLPFEVNDDSKARSGVHADISLGGTLRTAWRDNTRLLASLDLRHSQPLTESGTPTSNARLGMAAAARGRSWSLLTGIAAQPFVINGELDRHEFSWFAAGARHLSGPVGLGGSLALTKGNYAINPDRDFEQWEVAAGPRIAIGGTAVLKLDGIFGRRNAEVDNFSYDRRGGAAGITVSYANGYRLDIAGALINDRYDELSFGFDRIQEDLTTVAQAKLIKGNLVIGGFSPSIGVGYNETRSTLDIYDKRGFTFELGLARPY